MMSFHNVSSQTIPKSYQKNFVIAGSKSRFVSDTEQMLSILSFFLTENPCILLSLTNKKLIYKEGLGRLSVLAGSAEVGANKSMISVQQQCYLYFVLQS